MNRSALIGLSNELDAAGWCRLAPYGRTNKAVRTFANGVESVTTYVQVLDRDGATALANGFNSVWGRLKRAIAAVPLYDGHPDLHRVAPANADAAAGDEVPVGTINRLEARADGLYAQVGLFPAGQALANSGRKWISPLWWAEPVALLDSATTVRPVELISGGLTDRPNISGGEALDNQQPATAEPKTDTDIMKQLLIGLLAARGIALANTDTEDAILSRTAGLITKLDGDLAAANTERTTLANEKAALANEKAALITERDALKATSGALTTERDQARTALANERTARAEALVDLAIAQGKLAIADRDARIAKLAGATDFGAEATAIANEQVKHRTSGAEMGSRRNASNVATARERLIALENDAKYKDMPYASRFDAIMRDHPDLKAALNDKSAA